MFNAVYYHKLWDAFSGQITSSSFISNYFYTKPLLEVVLKDKCNSLHVLTNIPDDDEGDGGGGGDVVMATIVVVMVMMLMALPSEECIL
jgi:hypothetical protein